MPWYGWLIGGVVLVGFLVGCFTILFSNSDDDRPGIM